MPLERLTALLCLLGSAWLPTASERPGPPQAAPPRSWAAANETWAPSPGAPDPLVPAPARGSWKAFLGLQRTRRVGVPAAMSLPLDPQEVTREVCKAVPFTQVLSRPGCAATHLRNHLCFGHCSSLYIPGSDSSPLVLCKSCEPTRKHRASVVLWCHAGSPASHRRVKISTILVEGCHCSPKA
ncbi:DAN domain family member 5 [Carlito syrichta]|uniref:DAN domain family member 5 n=1 Tax=Carlito syrichta TaxID=1868482 RepID=A0A1U7SXC7_CARSF|nr:DAN domain family member 5 [Carlito syrichta]